MHYRRNHSTPQFKCDTCQRAFYYSSDYNSHLKVCVKESYTCEHCGVIFKLEAKMKMHISKVHSKPKNDVWTCDQCEKTYSRRSALVFHIKNYCGQQPKMKCMECSQSFYTKYNLATHVLTKHFDFASAKLNNGTKS